MEKKTIGKFIAALRRAHGMTQRELGDRLFVSDKTVSRWECDECTPELSLIPAIAEIFGITTDELLRGERNNPDHEVGEEGTERRRAKSDKQFRLMLDQKQRRYSNQTIVSLFITLLGFIGSLVINVGFARGLIAFCVSTALLAGSEICQLCGVTGARILPDEDDDSYIDRIRQFNSRVVRRAVTITFINLASFAFMLPAVTLIDGRNFGLSIGSWLLYGALFALIALVILHIIYTLLVRRLLLEHELIISDERQNELHHKNNRLLLRLAAIATAIALVIGVGIFVLNTYGHQGFVKEQTFTDCEEFKAFMEREYDEWADRIDRFDVEYLPGMDDVTGSLYTEIAPSVSIDTEPIDPPDSADIELGGEDAGEQKKQYAKIVGSDGSVLCEYYYNPELYYAIIFSDTDDKMPVTVITEEDRQLGIATFRFIERWLYVAIVLDYLVAAVIYVTKMLMAYKAAKART